MNAEVPNFTFTIAAADHDSSPYYIDAIRSSTNMNLRFYHESAYFKAMTTTMAPRTKILLEADAVSFHYTNECKKLFAATCLGGQSFSSYSSTFGPLPDVPGMLDIPRPVPGASNWTTRCFRQNYDLIEATKDVMNFGMEVIDPALTTTARTQQQQVQSEEVENEDLARQQRKRRTSLQKRRRRLNLEQQEHHRLALSSRRGGGGTNDHNTDSSGSGFSSEDEGADEDGQKEGLFHDTTTTGWDEVEGQLQRLLPKSRVDTGIKLIAATQLFEVTSKSSLINNFVQLGKEDPYTFVNYVDGTFAHVWRSPKEARRYMTSAQRVWQAILENRLTPFACPISTMMQSRGRCVTFTPMVPLYGTDTCDDDKGTREMLNLLATLVGTSGNGTGTTTSTSNTAALPAATLSSPLTSSPSGADASGAFPPLASAPSTTYFGNASQERENYTFQGNPLVSTNTAEELVRMVGEPYHGLGSVEINPAPLTSPPYCPRTFAGADGVYYITRPMAFGIVVEHLPGGKNPAIAFAPLRPEIYSRMFPFGLSGEGSENTAATNGGKKTQFASSSASAGSSSLLTSTANTFTASQAVSRVIKTSFAPVVKAIVKRAQSGSRVSDLVQRGFLTAVFRQYGLNIRYSYLILQECLKQVTPRSAEEMVVVDILEAEILCRALKAMLRADITIGNAHTYALTELRKAQQAVQEHRDLVARQRGNNTAGPPPPPPRTLADYEDSYYLEKANRLLYYVNSGSRSVWVQIAHVVRSKFIGCPNDYAITPTPKLAKLCTWYMSPKMGFNFDSESGQFNHVYAALPVWYSMYSQPEFTRVFLAGEALRRQEEEDALSAERGVPPPKRPAGPTSRDKYSIAARQLNAQWTYVEGLLKPSIIEYQNLLVVQRGERVMFNDPFCRRRQLKKVVRERISELPTEVTKENEGGRQDIDVVDLNLCAVDDPAIAVKAHKIDADVVDATRKLKSIRASYRDLNSAGGSRGTSRGGTFSGYVRPSNNDPSSYKSFLQKHNSNTTNSMSTQGTNPQSNATGGVGVSRRRPSVTSSDDEDEGVVIPMGRGAAAAAAASRNAAGEDDVETKQSKQRRQTAISFLGGSLLGQPVESSAYSSATTTSNGGGGGRTFSDEDDSSDTSASDTGSITPTSGIGPGRTLVPLNSNHPVLSHAPHTSTTSGSQFLASNRSYSQLGALKGNRSRVIQDLYEDAAVEFFETDAEIKTIQYNLVALHPITGKPVVRDKKKKYALEKLLAVLMTQRTEAAQVLAEVQKVAEEEVSRQEELSKLRQHEEKRRRLVLVHTRIIELISAMCRVLYKYQQGSASSVCDRSVFEVKRLAKLHNSKKRSSSSSSDDGGRGEMKFSGGSEIDEGANFALLPKLFKLRLVKAIETVMKYRNLHSAAMTHFAAKLLEMYAPFAREGLASHPLLHFFDSSCRVGFLYPHSVGNLNFQTEHGNWATANYASIASSSPSNSAVRVVTGGESDNTAANSATALAGDDSNPLSILHRARNDLEASLRVAASSNGDYIMKNNSGKDEMETPLLQASLRVGDAGDEIKEAILKNANVFGVGVVIEFYQNALIKSMAQNMGYVQGGDAVEALQRGSVHFLGSTLVTVGNALLAAASCTDVAILGAEEERQERLNDKNAVSGFGRSGVFVPPSASGRRLQSDDEATMMLSVEEQKKAFENYSRVDTLGASFRHAGITLQLHYHTTRLLAVSNRALGRHFVAECSDPVYVDFRCAPHLLTLGLECCASRLDTHKETPLEAMQGRTNPVDMSNEALLSSSKNTNQQNHQKFLVAWKEVREAQRKKRGHFTIQITVNGLLLHLYHTVGCHMTIREKQRFEIRKLTDAFLGSIPTDIHMQTRRLQKDNTMADALVIYKNHLSELQAARDLFNDDLYAGLAISAYFYQTRTETSLEDAELYSDAEVVVAFTRVLAASVVAVEDPFRNKVVSPIIENHIAANRVYPFKVKKGTLFMGKEEFDLIRSSIESAMFARNVMIMMDDVLLVRRMWVVLNIVREMYYKSGIMYEDDEEFDESISVVDWCHQMASRMRHFAYKRLHGRFPDGTDERRRELKQLKMSLNRDADLYSTGMYIMEEMSRKRIVRLMLEDVELVQRSNIDDDFDEWSFKFFSDVSAYTATIAFITLGIEEEQERWEIQEEEVMEGAETFAKTRKIWSKYYLRRIQEENLATAQVIYLETYHEPKARCHFYENDVPTGYFKLITNSYYGYCLQPALFRDGYMRHNLIAYCTCVVDPMYADLKRLEAKEFDEVLTKWAFAFFGDQFKKLMDREKLYRKRVVDQEFLNYNASVFNPVEGTLRRAMVDDWEEWERLTTIQFGKDQCFDVIFPEIRTREAICKREEEAYRHLIADRFYRADRYLSVELPQGFEYANTFISAQEELHRGWIVQAPAWGTFLDRILIRCESERRTLYFDRENGIFGFHESTRKLIEYDEAAWARELMMLQATGVLSPEVPTPIPTQIDDPPTLDGDQNSITPADKNNNLVETASSMISAKEERQTMLRRLMGIGGSPSDFIDILPIGAIPREEAIAFANLSHQYRVESGKFKIEYFGEYEALVRSEVEERFSVEVISDILVDKCEDFGYTLRERILGRKLRMGIVEREAITRAEMIDIYLHDTRVTVWESVQELYNHLSAKEDHLYRELIDQHVVIFQEYNARGNITMDESFIFHELSLCSEMLMGQLLDLYPSDISSRENDHKDEQWYATYGAGGRRGRRGEEGGQFPLLADGGIDWDAMRRRAFKEYTDSSDDVSRGKVFGTLAADEMDGMMFLDDPAFATGRHVVFDSKLAGRHWNRVVRELKHADHHKDNRHFSMIPDEQKKGEEEVNVAEEEKDVLSDSLSSEKEKKKVPSPTHSFRYVPLSEPLPILSAEIDGPVYNLIKHRREFISLLARIPIPEYPLIRLQLEESLRRKEIEEWYANNICVSRAELENISILSLRKFYAGHVGPMYNAIEEWQDGAEERVLKQEKQHQHHPLVSKHGGGRKVAGKHLPSLPNQNTASSHQQQPRRVAPPATPLERWESLLRHAKAPRIALIPTNRRGLDRDYVHHQENEDKDDSDDLEEEEEDPALVVTNTRYTPHQQYRGHHHHLHSHHHLASSSSPLSPPAGGLGSRSHTEAFASADFAAAKQHSSSVITQSLSSSSAFNVTKSGRSQKNISQQPVQVKYYCYTLELFAARCILTCLPTVASINLTPMLPSQGHILSRFTAGFRKQMQGWLEVMTIHVLQQEADEFIRIVDEFVDIFRELEKPRHLRRRRGGGNRSGGNAGDVPTGLPVLDANSAPFEVPPSSESEGEDDNNTVTTSSIRRRGATEIVAGAADSTASNTADNKKKLRKKKSPSPLVALVDAAIDQFDAAEQSMIKLLLVEDILNVESVMRLRLQVLEHRAAMSLYIALSRKKQPSPTIVAGPGGEEITVTNVRTGAGGALLSKHGGALLLPHSSPPPSWMVNQAKAIPERRFYHDIFTPLEILDREDDLFIRPSAAARRGLPGLPPSSQQQHQQRRGTGGGEPQRKRRGVLRPDDLLGGDNGDIATIDPSRLDPFQINFDVTMKFYVTTIKGLGGGAVSSKINNVSSSPQTDVNPIIPAHLTTSTMLSQLQHVLKRIRKLPVSSTFVDLSAITGSTGRGCVTEDGYSGAPPQDDQAVIAMVTLLDDAVLRQASRAASLLAFPPTAAPTSNPYSTTASSSYIPPFLAVNNHSNILSTAVGGGVATPRGGKVGVVPPLLPLISSGDAAIPNNAINSPTKMTMPDAPTSSTLSALMGMRSAMVDTLQGKRVASTEVDSSGGGGGSSKTKRSNSCRGGVGAAMLTFESDIWELYHLLVVAPPVAALHTLCANVNSSNSKIPDAVVPVADALTNAYLPLTLLSHIFPHAAISSSANTKSTMPSSVVGSRPGSSSGRLGGNIHTRMNTNTRHPTGVASASESPLPADEQWCLLSPSSTLSMQLVSLNIGGLFTSDSLTQAQHARAALLRQRCKDLEESFASSSRACPRSRPSSGTRPSSSSRRVGIPQTPNVEPISSLPALRGAPSKVPPTALPRPASAEPRALNEHQLAVSRGQAATPPPLSSTALPKLRTKSAALLQGMNTTVTHNNTTLKRQTRPAKLPTLM